jgi:hypothetical protein
VRDYLPLLLIGAAIVAMLAGLPWLASRARRSGMGGAIMGPFDEIYHPAAHRFRAEIQVQEERMVPLPSADDQPRPHHAG